MVKSEIVKHLHLKHPSLKRSQIKTIVDIIFNQISENLINNKPVELRRFGRFSVKSIKDNYNANAGNPSLKKISFKMSKHLKEEINS